MAMDYSKSLNLPTTDFPMRGGLPEKEPVMIADWQKNKIYEKRLERNRHSGKKFILHDGPPYANGGIHLGTALNKVLKDMIVRYNDMKGCFSPYVPGWDTHGLPTEQKAIHERGLKRHEVGPVVFRQACSEIALKYLDVQREAFKRLGVVGDWDHPYITLQPEFEAKQIEVFGEMAKTGCIYKGLKPVYWCPSCETALAEAEIEYMEKHSQSIYVKFPVKEDGGKLAAIAGSLENLFVLIWTTTTWTLPGNMAISVNPEFTYVVVDTGKDCLVVAKELVTPVMKAGGVTSWTIMGEIKGEEMEGMRCRHPFLERDSLVIVGDHVTLDAGTGCVHTAPGHGVEDFEVCKKYPEIDVLVPVDHLGHLTQEAGKFAGLFYKKANDAILEELKSLNLLFADEALQHQYPHCWRCKNPIIFRATEQWFISIDSFREKALEAIKTVRWIPAWGEERITKMVGDRNDWCISRQRTWGVPIPIFYCKSCGESIINDESIYAVKTLFAKEGSTAWFAKEAKDILPEGFACPCGGTEFRKETDIMDVWFDSGSSHVAVLETREDLSSPADMYLEGSDQHRGWFQSSLLTSVVARNRAPYRQVLTHGYVVDGQGRKMSKSLGNGIDPLDVSKQYGADILRLWVAFSDYKTDIRVSNDILKQIAESYRKIRNTARFLLGNLGGFQPETDRTSFDAMLELDRWAMMQLNHLVEKVEAAYGEYDFHTMSHAIHHFCVVDMSNFYLDVTKDRMYASATDSVERRSGQTAMVTILDTLVRLLAPVLCFTSEEIWQYLPHMKADNPESIQLNAWPVLHPEWNDAVLEVRFSALLGVRDVVLKALEEARAKKEIGQSLQAKVVLTASGETLTLLQENRELLTTFFICSQVAVEAAAVNTGSGNAVLGELSVQVLPAEGQKCERCWTYADSVGQNSVHPTVCKRCADVVIDIAACSDE